MRNVSQPVCACLALAVFLGCSDGGGGGGWKKPVKIHGSGNLIDELRPVGEFTRVTHASEGEVRIEQAVPAAEGGTLPFTLVVCGDDGSLQVARGLLGGRRAAGETLLVRAEDNLQKHLVSEAEGGVLKLRTAKNVDLVPTLPIEFFVTVASLEGVSFKGVGGVEVRDLTTDALALSCSGVGDVDVFDLDAAELNVEVGGICHVRVSGIVDRQTVELGGLGTYLAEMLQSDEANVRVTGPNSATVRVCDVLVATIKSSGSVYYFGSPTVEATIDGSGTVEQVGPSCELLPPR